MFLQDTVIRFQKYDLLPTEMKRADCITIKYQPPEGLLSGSCSKRVVCDFVRLNASIISNITN